MAKKRPLRMRSKRFLFSFSVILWLDFNAYSPLDNKRIGSESILWTKF